MTSDGDLESILTMHGVCTPNTIQSLYVFNCYVILEGKALQCVCLQHCMLNERDLAFLERGGERLFYGPVRALRRPVSTGH